MVSAKQNITISTTIPTSSSNAPMQRSGGDPGTTYSYDKDGNLIQECDKTNSADPVTYEYTAENRLAVVKQGGTVLMAAMYDGDNNRVFRTG